MKETPLLPENDARDTGLFFVVCTLCFLAALAALSAKSTYAAARAWTADLQGELTVRLSDTDRRGAEEALAVIEETTGVASAQILSQEETEALLEPTFGRVELPAGLPLPLLVAVQADPDSRDVAGDMARRLTEAGFSAIVDEHGEWAGDIRRTLGVVRFAAFTIVALLFAAAIAVIMFATHSALLARRDIVELLHLSGARDRFIAALFERRFWILGLRSGSIGAAAALGVAALMIFLARSREGRSGLLPELSLDMNDLLILVMTPIIAGFAARLATRMTVLRALKETSPSA